MNDPISVQSFGLGTLIRVTAFGNDAKEALDEAIFEIGEIDDKMSYFKKTSEITRINENAGGEFQKVSKETYQVIRCAVKYGEISDGAIDITTRPIVDLWGIGNENITIPAEAEIRKALKLVNYKRIEFDDHSRSIRLQETGQSIDLGAIAKGFAADEARAVLKENKITNGLIDLGGNIYAHGTKPDGSDWKIGIQNPMAPRGNYIGILSVRDKSVVTSGDYEKFFMYNNKKYHHIIDPRTGYPVRNKIISATILSDDSIDGDALTTCLYVMGVEKGLSLIEKMEGIDAVVITEDKKIYTTENIKESFIITDQEFQP